MSTIADRVATALSRETGVPVESIAVTRDGAWWEAECDGVRVAARRRGAIIEVAAEGYPHGCLRFPDNTRVDTLRASIAKARRMAQSCARHYASRA